MLNKTREGIVLPVVIFVMAIIMIFGLTSLFMTSSIAKFNSVDENSKIALEYAEAGYNDYLWYLNDKPDFYSTEASEDMENTDIAFGDGFFRLSVTKPSNEDRFVTIKSTGWTKENPDIKKTIEVKIRKKQFVHHVYVSNREELNGTKVYWGGSDKIYGPLHTNGDLNIMDREAPEFFNTVTYVKNYNKGSGRPIFHYPPKLPEKVGSLDFPEHNGKLKEWALKDGANIAYFEGRTCIYLQGDTVKIRNRNQTADQIQTINMSEFKNKVIYVHGNANSGMESKFHPDAGNIFISGELQGQLTIGASNNIYITASDPTEWYDYTSDPFNDQNNKPSQINPSTIRNNTGRNNQGLVYKNSDIDPESSNLSKDMLGLIANNDVMILHYGWPKYDDEFGYSWNFNWNWRPGYWDGYWWGPREWVEGKWVKGSTNHQLHDVAPNTIDIYSAIFGIEGGFGFESYNSGTGKTVINLYGNITQQTRKAVKQGSSGYGKNYNHDPRMLYDYPPHILEPTNVGWEVHDWKQTNDHLE